MAADDGIVRRSSSMTLLSPVFLMSFMLAASPLLVTQIN
jgi:hypothetical protein